MGAGGDRRGDVQPPRRVRGVRGWEGRGGRAPLLGLQTQETAEHPGYSALEPRLVTLVIIVLVLIILLHLPAARQFNRDPPGRCKQTMQPTTVTLPCKQPAVQCELSPRHAGRPPAGPGRALPPPSRPRPLIFPAPALSSASLLPAPAGPSRPGARLRPRPGFIRQIHSFLVY